MRQWKKFDNQSIFDKDMDKTLWLTFLGHPVYLGHSRRDSSCLYLWSCQHPAIDGWRRMVERHRTYIQFVWACRWRWLAVAVASSLGRYYDWDVSDARRRTLEFPPKQTASSKPVTRAVLTEGQSDRQTDRRIDISAAVISRSINVVAGNTYRQIALWHTSITNVCCIPFFSKSSNMISNVIRVRPLCYN